VSLLSDLAELVSDRGPLFVLTGAGCSTGSGIPDYRDGKGRWKRSQPIRFQEFLRSETSRQRYWARSLAGWPRVAHARPCAAHQALVALERAGFVRQVVTQNVDGLHQLAGQRRVIDLHGRLAWVDCLDCRRRLPRGEMQAQLQSANPNFEAGAQAFAPDGDAVVDAALVAGFRVPACPVCGGVLKPAVVFYGENVPRPRVEHAFARLRESGALLVAGSSLTVYSGFRFCREAAERGIPIAVVNLGQTRADGMAPLKLDAEVGESLKDLAGLLGVQVTG